MASRSPRPYHNQWPNVGNPGQLPNVPGSPTQNPSLQQGDICYDDVSRVYYYCTLENLGGATWAPFGGTPPTPAFAPRVVVGNAPNGDTTADCDYLDPGDGTGIEAALNEANSYSEGCDVWVRPGTYDLRPGNVTSAFPINPGVRFWGAGASTRIIGRDQGSRRVFRIRVPGGSAPTLPTELAWLVVLIPDEQGPVTETEAILIDGEIGAGSNIHDLAVSSLNFASGNPSWVVTAPFAMIRTDSSAAPGFAGITLERVTLSMPANSDAPLINPLDGFCALLSYSASGTAADPQPLYLTDCRFYGGDYALASLDQNFIAVDSNFIATNYGFLGSPTAGVLLERPATFSAFTGCFLSSDGNYGLTVTNRYTGTPLTEGQGPGLSNCIVRSLNDYPINVEDVVSIPGNGVDFGMRVVGSNVISPSGGYAAVALYNVASNIIGMNVFQTSINPAVVQSSAPNNEIAHNIRF